LPPTFLIAGDSFSPTGTPVLGVGHEQVELENLEREALAAVRADAAVLDFVRVLTARA
jgi:hypothetical protein